jgi:hypothetical protein
VNNPQWDFLCMLRWLNSNPTERQDKHQAIKKGEFIPPLCSFFHILFSPISTQKHIEVPCPVGQNGGIDYLSAAGALPGIKGPDKIVKLLGKHAAFTSGAFHFGTS